MRRSRRSPHRARSAWTWPAALLWLALLVPAVPAVAQPDAAPAAGPVQASAEPAAQSYAAGEQVEVSGQVGNADGQEVTASLLAPDGTIVAGPVPVVVAPDGSYDVTFDPEATAGLEIGPESGFHQVLAVVVDSVPADAPEGTTPTRLAIEPVGVSDAPEGLVVTNSFVSSVGWVKPGEVYPSTITVANYSTDPEPDAAVSVPAVDGMSFTAVHRLEDSGTAVITGTGDVLWTTGEIEGATLDGEELIPATRTLIVTATADTLDADPQVVWKNLSTTASVVGSDEPLSSSLAHGPKVVPPGDSYESARYGDRPFPVVPVEFYDFSHHPDNSGEDLRTVINDPGHEGSTFNLFQEMSYGQLFPNASVPSSGIATADFPAEPIRFHQLDVNDPDVCYGAYDPENRLPATRIEQGFYQLPGDLEFYGSDSGQFGDETQRPANGGSIDDACGTIGKAVYDAAAIADPEIDYNDFDTDKDGVVDFFMMVYAGCGGNGPSQRNCDGEKYGETPENMPTGPTDPEDPGYSPNPGYDTIWPHSSTLTAQFLDPETGLTGYISDDQLTNLEGEPLYYTTEARVEFTTTDTGIPVYVRVGPYNVNPEDAIDFASVISHEYGHSLGLPDYYGLDLGEYYGTWNLMATDYSQHMDLNGRQELGWVIPQEIPPGASSVDMVDSTTNTQTIHWRQPDGTPYTLTGEGVANGDAWMAPLPRRILLDPDIVENGASASHVFWSGSGDDFECNPAPSAKSLDIDLSFLADVTPGTPVSLDLASYWDIEWDFDYGFLLVTTDDGATYTSLANEYTTPREENPFDVACQEKYGNGLTGTSGSYAAGTEEDDRHNGVQTPGDGFLPMSFDLTDYAGEDAAIRFVYNTDVAFTRPGWFIDDVVVSVDGTPAYTNDFEGDTAMEEVVNGGCAEGGGLQTGPCTDPWTYLEAGAKSLADHAYYFEMRDRTGFDLDSNGQADREPGQPTWDAGLSLVYTDEARGYGNTSAPYRPNQTVLDANPSPWLEVEDIFESLDPNLDDAAWRPESTPFSDFGDGWDDNYPEFDEAAGAYGNWTLDFGCLSLDVTAMTGQSDGPQDPPGNLAGTVDLVRGLGCGERDYGFGTTGNAPPTAVAQARATTVQVGSTVDFDGSMSSDDTTPIADLGYAWDLDGDQVIDATTQQASWTYDEVGEVEVTLTVTDENGATDTTTLTITVTATPPPPPTPNPGPAPQPEPEPEPEPEPAEDCTIEEDRIVCEDVVITGDVLELLDPSSVEGLADLGELLALLPVELADGEVVEITVTVPGGADRVCLVAFDQDGGDYVSTCTRPDDGGFAQDGVQTLTLAVDQPGMVGLFAGVTDETLRVFGSSRVTTAIEAARSGWDTASTALLANAGSFADALAAAPLAGALDAPLLLTDGQVLSDGVLAELQRLEVEEVVVLGGTAVITDGVAEAVSAAGITVRRIGGATRTATADALATEVGAADGLAVVASGGSFADPLAVAPLAASRQLPVFLTDGDGLTEATLQVIGDLGVTDVLVVGGEAVVPSSVADQLTDEGIAVDRRSGADRYGTAVSVLQWAEETGADLTEILVATGADFPDALTAGALGARTGRPVLLVDGQGTLPGSTSGEWLADHADTVELAVLLGGEAAIAEEVRTALGGLLE